MRYLGYPYFSLVNIIPFASPVNDYLLFILCTFLFFFFHYDVVGCRYVLVVNIVFRSIYKTKEVESEKIGVEKAKRKERGRGGPENYTLSENRRGEKGCSRAYRE